MHDDAEPMEYVPGLHGVGAVVALAHAEPAGHGRHAPDGLPAGDHVPGAHAAEGDAGSAGHANPAAHESQPLAVGVRARVKGGHGLHAAAPPPL